VKRIILSLVVCRLSVFSPGTRGTRRDGQAGHRARKPPGRGTLGEAADSRSRMKSATGVVAGGYAVSVRGNPVGITGPPARRGVEYDADGDKWTKKKKQPIAAIMSRSQREAARLRVGGGVQTRRACTRQCP